MSHHTEKFKQAIIDNTDRGLSFEDAIQQWDLLHVVDRRRCISNCICDKEIRYEYHIRNRDLDANLIVGSSCIMKVVDSQLDLHTQISRADKIIKMGERKVQFGAKMKGKTFNEIANDPSCSKWVIQNLTTPWSSERKEQCRINLREYIKLIR